MSSERALYTQRLFSLECLVCIDRAEVLQSGLLLSSVDSSLQLYCLARAYLSPPFPKLLLLTPILEPLL